MDKREYQEKLKEINQLIADENYAEAAKVADTIDWKRVRNVQTLVMISEIYEAVERYEDSKVLLMRAYRRSPLGRTVLYRLVEVTIRLGQFDQAIEYYSEYVQAAPHDNNKYILKYKIYRGRGASLDEQIDILKAYLDQEYNEKWAYELAKVQIQADRVQEGLSTCDDLVLWFHSGKYVIKALELKKKYAPLTPKQKEIYDNRFEEEDEDPSESSAGWYLRQAQTMARAEQAAKEQEEIKSELAADISHTARVEATRADISRKAEEALSEVDRKAGETEKAIAERAAEDDKASANSMQEEAPEDPVQGTGEVSRSASQEPEEASQSAAQESEEELQSASQEPEEVSQSAAQEPEETPPSAVQESADAVRNAAEESAEEVQSTSQESAGNAQSQELADGLAAGYAAMSAAEMLESIVEESAQELQSEGQESAQELQSEGQESAQELQSEGQESAQELQSETPEPGKESQIASQEMKEPADESDMSEEEDAADEDPGLSDEAEISQEEEEETSQVSPEQLQEDMIRSMREIVRGVGPKTELGEEEAALEEAIDRSKEDQEMAVAARGADRGFRVPESQASQKRASGKLTIDDILLSMGDKGDYVRRMTGGSVLSADEEAEMSGSGDVLAQTDKEPEIPRFLKGEVKEARQTAEIPTQQIAMAADAAMGEGSKEGFGERAASAADEEVSGRLSEDVKDGSSKYGNEYANAGKAGAAAGGETSAGAGAAAFAGIAAGIGAAAVVGAATAAGSAAASGAGAAAGKVTVPGAGAADFADSPAGEEGMIREAVQIFSGANKVAYTEEIAQAKTKKLPVEEIRKLHEAFLSENAGAAGEAVMNNAAKAAERAARSAEEEASASDFSGAGSATADEIGKVRSAREEYRTGEAGKEISGTDRPDMGQTSEDMFGTGPDGTLDGMSGTGPDGTSDSMSGNGPEGSGGKDRIPGTKENLPEGERRLREQRMHEVPKTEPEPEVMTGRMRLTDSQRELFAGFTSIGNLEEQIAGAIWQAENRRDDRTSRSGNILILGAHGCGKTTIATGIAKAVAEDAGTHSVKMARIYAADLNRKDIAATIAKIAGGILIVEEAGDLDDVIVDQMTTAMEFRTDGLIVILEDEQRYIHDLLMRHPRFTMKFTAQIYIPEYTGEDLVNFGQLYAMGKDYVFSDEAAAVLLERVEGAMKKGEAVSVTNVIELTDRAIKNASTFLRRIGSAKKRYDDMDRVILRAKDLR